MVGRGFHGPKEDELEIRSSNRSTWLILVDATGKARRSHVLKNVFWMLETVLLYLETILLCLETVNQSQRTFCTVFVVSSFLKHGTTVPSYCRKSLPRAFFLQLCLTHQIMRALSCRQTSKVYILQANKEIMKIKEQQGWH